MCKCASGCWFLLCFLALLLQSEQHRAPRFELLVHTHVNMKVQQCSLGHIRCCAQLVFVYRFVWNLYWRAKLHVIYEFSLHAYA